MLKYGMLKAESAIDLGIGAEDVFLLIVAVCAAAVILKGFGFKGAPILVTLTTVFCINTSVGAFFGVKEIFSSLSAYADIEPYASAALKVVGIGYLSGIGQDVCRELGETGAARSISIVSRLELIAIAAPFISDALTEAVKLVGG